VALGDNLSVKMVSASDDSNLKNKLSNLSTELLNPFIHIRNWIKGEMLNLGALIDSIGEKESCDIRKQAAIKKLQNDREMVKKLSDGKFTLKHMFRSNASKTQVQSSLLEDIA